MAGVNLCSFMNQLSQSATVNEHLCLRLTHMCTMLPTYGLQDLRELLGTFGDYLYPVLWAAKANILFKLQAKWEHVNAPCSMPPHQICVDRLKLSSSWRQVKCCNWCWLKLILNISLQPLFFAERINKNGESSIVLPSKVKRWGPLCRRSQWTKNQFLLSQHL